MSKTPVIFRHVPVDPKFTGPGVAVEITSDAGRRLAVAVQYPSDGFCAFIDRLHPNEDARVAVRRVGAFGGANSTTANETNALMAICHRDALPGAREAFAAAGISGEMRQALDLMFEHGVPPFPDWLRYARHQTGNGLWEFVALGLTHPVLYGLSKDRDPVLSGLSRGVPLDEVIRTAWPSIRTDHIRGLARDRRDFKTVLKGPRGRILEGSAHAAASAMFAMPSEWMPADREGWQAFAILANASETVVDTYGLDWNTLLAPGRGDWAGYLTRVAATAGAQAPEVGDDFDFTLMENLEDTMSEALDPPMHLANTLVMPLLAHRWADMDIDRLRETAIKVAARWLYGDRSLNTVIDASILWHHAQHFIDTTIMGERGEYAWPPLMPDRDLGEGIRAVFIADRHSLVDEGAKRADALGVPGLDHCVATYLPKALRGHSHLVSIRRMLPGGLYERLATAELVFSNDGEDIRVEQAKGMRNAEPSQLAMDALNGLVDAVNGRRIPIDPMVSTRRESSGYEDEETVADACGYDWTDESLVLQTARAWGRLLPREIRGMDVRELRARAMKDSED